MHQMQRLAPGIVYYVLQFKCVKILLIIITFISKPLIIVKNTYLIIIIGVVEKHGTIFLIIYQGGFNTCDVLQTVVPIIVVRWRGSSIHSMRTEE